MVELSIKNLKAAIRKIIQEEAADTFKTNIEIQFQAKKQKT